MVGTWVGAIHELPLPKVDIIVDLDISKSSLLRILHKRGDRKIALSSDLINHQSYALTAKKLK